MGCLPHILFAVIKVALFTLNFGSGPVSPKIHQHSEQNTEVEITKEMRSRRFRCFLQKSKRNEKMDEKNSARVLFTCIIAGCLPRKKNLSTALLRATLGTLRAGSPFRVLPLPSLEGMSALRAPSASRTQPYSWGQKSKTQKSKNKYPKSKIHTSHFACVFKCV